MAKNKLVSVFTTGTSILNFIALMSYIFIITKLEKKTHRWHWDRPTWVKSTFSLLLE